ncbi:MAG: hypothetical protein AB7K68_07780 [Bacteriovoracia bacterium]
MNILLWVLQVLLALHTAIGAVWKFSHSAEQTMPSLKAISGGAWFVLTVFEIVCALCLVVPAAHRPLAPLASIAALLIAAEMLLFCGLHISAGAATKGPTVYWLVVAALCGFIAYGRYVMSPLS